MPNALDHRQVTAWRNAMFVIFGVCGLAMASWAARLPSIRDGLGIEPYQVGLLIFSISAGSIVGLLGSGHIVGRLGTIGTIRAAFVVGPIGFVIAGAGVSFGPVIPLTVGGLIVFGIAYSVCDVAMNVSAASNERALGRTIMPVFHALFSVGTVAGALLGAGLERLAVPIWIHILGVGAVMAIAGLVAVRSLQRDDHDADAPKPSLRERLSFWRDPRTLLIGVLVLGMAFAEGSANDWVALAAVDGHGVDNAGGAAVFGVFVVAMTAGRLLGVRLLDRFGRVPVLRVSAGLAIVGLLCFIYGPSLPVAIVGVALWGLGASLGFPVGMSAASDDPRTASARVSVVATIGYAAFLVGPPLIGGLGQVTGYLHALIVVLVLVLIAGLVSPAARKRV